jgi:hypothetical protein
MARITALLCISLSLLFSCGQEGVTELRTNQVKDGIPVMLAIERGEEWLSRQKMMVFNLAITPQVAVWIETDEGKYIDTLFVTKAFGKQKFGYVEASPDATVRPSSLPYWMNKRISAGLGAPTKKDPLPDSVTGATPKGDSLIRSKIGGELRKFWVRVELNKSFDGNDAFHGKWDGTDAGYTEPVINGQPSVIYGAMVDLDSPAASYVLKYMGHGGETASDAELYAERNGLTTALEMVEGIRFSME